VQETPDAGGTAGLDNLAGELNVDMAETTPVTPAFIENSYQVDHGVTPGKLLFQIVRIMHVGFDQVRARQEDQGVFVAFAVSGKDTELHAIAHQPVGKHAPDKTGTSKDADFSDYHIF